MQQQIFFFFHFIIATMDLNNLPELTKLPTTFFPSPQPSGNENPRTIAVAYDYSNYGDAMIAKSIHSDLLRPTDDIRLVYIVNQNDFRNFMAPMMPGYGSSADVADTYFKNFVGAFMWEITTVLNKRGVRTSVCMCKPHINFY